MEAVALRRGYAPDAFVFSDNPTVSKGKYHPVRIGGETFTLTELVGADLAETLANLAESINEADLCVEAVVTGDALSLRARYAGDWVNGLALDCTSDVISEGGRTFGAVPNAEAGEGCLGEWIMWTLRYTQVNAQTATELERIFA